jgi:hypothetical protein
MILRCPECPYATLSDNIAGGTCYYHCKLDTKVTVSEDRIIDCPASLEILVAHKFADTLFAETISFRTRLDALWAEKKALEDGLLVKARTHILDFGGSIPQSFRILRQAIDELEAAGQPTSEG